jgi:hypothetical protein
MRIGSISTVERAYQIARSGKFRLVSEVQQQLRMEGFTDAKAQLTSRTLTADLRRAMEAARQDA